MNLKNCSNFILLGIILAVVGMVASGILAWVAGVTREPIEASKVRKLEQSLSSVLPENARIGEKKITIDGVTFYPSFSEDVLIGFAASGFAPSGYAGKIEGLVGISVDGKILELPGGRSAVLITRQQETPGLGTNVCNRTEAKTLKTVFGDEPEANGMPANKVLDSFKGMEAADAPLAITKDGGKIEFITGATVSSRAVTDMVNSVLTVFGTNSDKIIEGVK